MAKLGNLPIDPLYKDVYIYRLSPTVYVMQKPRPRQKNNEIDSRRMIVMRRDYAYFFPQEHINFTLI
jgi:hypothetical protein